MNEPKSQPFIREWYFTPEPKQKKKGRLGQLYGSPAVLEWKAAAGWTAFITAFEERLTLVAPAYPFKRETMRKVCLRSLSCMKTKCQSYRQAAMSARPVWPCEERFFLPPSSIGSPSVGKRSCRRRENLPRPLSRPNKATIISLFSSCSIWAIMAGTPSVSSALPTHRAEPAEVLGTFCSCVCVCPWCVKSHNLIKFSVEGNTGSKCNFCPILIKANLIFFPFCELKSLPTLFHLGSMSTGRNPKTQAGCEDNRLAFINV